MIPKKYPLENQKLILINMKTGKNSFQIQKELLDVKFVSSFEPIMLNIKHEKTYCHHWKGSKCWL